MKRNNWVKDNIKIDKDTKLIIGLGDSFCAGTGTESLETWNRNNWDVNQMRQDGLGFWESYDNSFINVLKTKYLNDFTSINLGMGGRGNRFAIRELLLLSLVYSLFLLYKVLYHSDIIAHRTK